METAAVRHVGGNKKSPPTCEEPKGILKHLDDWLLTRLTIPRHLTKDGRPAYNTLIIGRVGTGKTQMVKRAIPRLEVDNYAIVILDIEREYTEFHACSVVLPLDLVNTETLGLLLNTEAAYLDLLSEYLHVPGKLLEEYVEDRGIAGQQLTYFQRALKKVEHLTNQGEDLIEAINKHQTLRIKLDPDYAPQQIIILTRQLTEQHKLIDPAYAGVIVILEENERLAQIDKQHQIPSAIFAGRKRGIYYIVIGHTPIQQLQQSDWGRATVEQFDNIITLTGGCM